ncbi:MAG: hypothetical protein K2X00_21020 [Nitrospiraceae bacterium]|nr:hypothetical protein [Nitrospiraceae bacterium]
MSQDRISSADHRALHEEHLALAKRHVAESEPRVARQAALVVRLRADRHDTALAESVLAEFERTLADMRAHLRSLQAEHDAR